MKPRNTVITCALSLFFLLSFPALYAQVSASAMKVKGANATLTGLDLAHVAATIDVSNSSAKEITAFVLSYSILYSDGQTIRGEFTEDWGPQMSAAHKALQPGGRRVETISLPNREPASVTVVNVEVSLVAYNDQTAEAGSNDILERLVAERMAQARALQKSADAIATALNNQNDEHPAATALQSITSLRNDVQINHSKGTNVGYLNETIKRLEALPKGANERVYLTHELTNLQPKAALYREYAQLRRLP